MGGRGAGRGRRGRGGQRGALVGELPHPSSAARKSRERVFSRFIPEVVCLRGGQESLPSLYIRDWFPEKNYKKQKQKFHISNTLLGELTPHTNPYHSDAVTLNFRAGDSGPALQSTQRACRRWDLLQLHSQSCDPTDPRSLNTPEISLRASVPQQQHINDARGRHQLENEK